MQRWKTMWGILWRSCLWGVSCGAIFGSGWGILLGVVGGWSTGVSIGWGIIGAVLGSMFGAGLGLILGLINGLVLSLVTGIAYVPLIRARRYPWIAGMLSVGVTTLFFLVISVLRAYPLPHPSTSAYTDPDIHRADFVHYVAGPASLALLSAAWASQQVAGWHIRAMHQEAHE
jgi:hypothetical protein